MKTRYGLLAGALIVMMGACGQANAGSDAEQLARMKDADQWPAPGRDFALTRHSDLADINTKNIGKLIWLQGTNAHAATKASRWCSRMSAARRCCS